jgi:hypothetical protein
LGEWVEEMFLRVSFEGKDSLPVAWREGSKGSSGDFVLLALLRQIRSLE